MGFLLAFLSLVLAEEVVELEEVRASVGNNTYKCNQINTTATECNKIPYCFWLITNDDGKKCIDNPCIASGALAADTPSCPSALLGTASITCVKETIPPTVLAGDCSGGTGVFCGTADNLGTYDYCFWASLRDNGTCPDSVCEKGADNRCVVHNQQECQLLTTKEECGLTPKCVWISSNSLGCVQDPCFVGSENKSCGGDFIDNDAVWIDAIVANRKSWQVKPTGGDLVKSDCISYKPYKSGSGTTNYCVYKDNTAPNICYFLGGNTTSNTDWGSTYPTYSVSPAKAPQCDNATKIDACDGHESTNCTTKWNPKGAFAGAYCGDASHGTNEGDGAVFLRGPSLLLLLASALLLLAW